MLNPLIVSHGSKEVFYWDACFSFKAAFFVKVLRHEEIEVTFLICLAKKNTESKGRAFRIIAARD